LDSLNQSTKSLICQKVAAGATGCLMTKLERQEDCLGNVTVTPLCG